VSASPYSLRSWLFPADPRRIGILYLVTMPLVGLAGFIGAVLSQAGILVPAGDLLEAKSYELLGAWHGCGMVLLVLLPAIPAGLGLAVFGSQPAPGPALAGWYLWLVAGAVWLGGLVRGEPDLRRCAIVAALSLALTFLSLMLAVRRRQRCGPFACSIVFSGTAWLARLATGGFEPASVAPLALVPALGVLAEVVRDSSGGALYGRRLVPWLLGAIAASTFLPWGSRLLALELGPVLAGGLLLAVLPPAALVAALLATVLRRPPARGPALAFAWASIGLAMISGGGFLLLASAPTNAHLAATAFESAHLHYMAGVVLAAFLAGLHHWRDAVAGRATADAATGLAAPLLFGAWNFAFFPSFVAGYLGRPWGPGALADSFGRLDTISLLGTLGLVAALGLAARDLLRSLFGHAPEPAARLTASKQCE
jgi:heme/copper-type cytochrome/quinol oxidase subunit 1